LSRAARLTIALEQRLADEAAKAASRPTPERTLEPWQEAGVDEARWEQISHASSCSADARELIERAIGMEYDLDEQDRLTEALSERMVEGRDEAAFLSDAPVAQIVAVICRDLGFKPNWKHLGYADEDGLDEATLRALRLGKYEPPPLAADGGDPRTLETAGEGGSVPGAPPASRRPG
jgi:hypothetical protein